MREMEWPNADVWRERILAAWDKYGGGLPLDPRTVERLAQEFAKPPWQIERVPPPSIDFSRNFMGIPISLSEAIPAGSFALISPRYNPATGDLDVEATAKASALIVNAGTKPAVD